MAYGNRTRLFGLKGRGPTQKSNAMLYGLHGTTRTYNLLTPDQAVYQIDITQR